MMRKIIIFQIGIILTLRLIGQGHCDGDKIVYLYNGICNTNPYVLVFEDNFNGNTLDLNKWELQTWRQGSLITDKNNQIYTLNPDNIDVSNGTLKIKANNQPKTRAAINYLPDTQILSDGLPNLRTYQYSSSNIWTKTKFSYGKYEIRCKIPKGKGFFPAFWTYGSPNNRWNEIDIFEFWNEKNIWGNYDPTKLSKVHKMNIHFDYDRILDGNSNYDCPTKYTGPDFSLKFHTFTLTWSKFEIAWYVDGHLKRLATLFQNERTQQVGCNGIKVNTFYIRNKAFPINPMNIILNLAVQSGNNSPDNNTSFPGVFEIDYVRYWKKNPIATPCNHNVVKFFPFNGYYQGDNALLALNATVKTGTNAEVVARNGIDIWHNFEVELGATFTARIDPVICGTARLADTTNYQSNNIVKDKGKLNKINPEINNILNNISIYPNPNTGKFTIEMANVSTNSLVEIYDIMGKKIWSTNKVNTKLTIDIAKQPKGIYLVKITTQNKIFTQKIIYQ